jgi:hypothetical protein
MEMSESSQSSSTLCQQCQSLDFNKLLSDQHSTRTLLQVEYFGNSARVEHICDLCRFLSQAYHWQSLAGHDMLIQSLVDSSIHGKIAYSPEDSEWQITCKGYSSTTAHDPLTLQHLQYLPRRWVEDCKREHVDRCASRLSDLPPGFRLIDCVERTTVLAETLHQRPVYVTLSYVWGTGFSQEAHSEIDAHDLPANLPQTIEDALEVTKRLGFRYLWVDRYCIRNENLQEKQTQIKRMGAIYGSSEVTLIDLDGENPDHGLLNAFGFKPRSHQLLTIGDFQIFLRTSAAVITASIPSRKWSQRGWTFQEALLSHRRLVFADDLMMFQCSESVAIEPELFTLSRNSQLEDYPLFPWDRVGTSPRDIWERIEEYSRKSLSFRHDAHNAIEGILKEFTILVIPAFTIWGIPIIPLDTWARHVSLSPKYVHPEPSDYQTCFLAGLHWRAEEYVARGRSGEFPSWSWLRHENQVTRPKSVYFSPKLDLQVTLRLENGAEIAWADIWTEKTMQLKYDSHDLLPILIINCWVLPLTLVSKAATLKDWNRGRNELGQEQCGFRQLTSMFAAGISVLQLGLELEEYDMSEADLQVLHNELCVGNIAGIMCGVDVYRRILLVRRVDAIHNHWERIGHVLIMIGEQYNQEWKENTPSMPKWDEYVSRLVKDQALVRREIVLV